MSRKEPLDYPITREVGYRAMAVCYIGIRSTLMGDISQAIK